MVARDLNRGAAAAIMLTVVAACDWFGGTQATYDTPDQASEALLAAAGSGDTSAMLRVLGEEAQPVVASGDAVADAERRDEFTELYMAAHRWESIAADAAMLVVGEDDWPFPFPLVKEERGWRFDTSHGIEEILDRRIGENELAAMQASLAYVDAQREYYWLNPEGAPLLHYARSFTSTQGRKDGLYWDAADGEPPSPLGALFAEARAEGYLIDIAHRPVPYYGYHFRILTSQGEHAAGGAYDYVVGDRMIGGFGLVAYPAERGSTGVMTFIVNHDGVVFSKDLGPDTAKLATEMTRFDPDDTWKREEVGPAAF
jgi:hypothetical protein